MKNVGSNSPLPPRETPAREEARGAWSDEFSLVRRLRDEEDDAPQTRPLEWGLIRRLFSFTRGRERKRNALIVLTIIRSVQLPAIVWVSSRIIAGPIARHEPDKIAWGMAGYLVLAIVMDGLFHFRQRYALEIGEGVVNALRREIFLHVQRMPMSFFHRVKLGRILSRVTSDVETIRTGLQDSFFVSIVQFGQMIFAAGVMAFTDWRLFLVVLGMAPILWYLNYYFRRKLSRDSRAAQESFSRVTATLAESVNGIRVTQGFVRQETNAGLFRRLLFDHARYNIAIARTTSVLIPLLELNSQFFIAILLILGGARVLHQEMPMSTLIAFLLFANQFFAPLQVLGNMYNQALIAMASAERIFWLLDLKPEWVDDPLATPLPDPRRAPSVPPAAVYSQKHDNAVMPLGVKVEFDGVSFGYDPERLVLHDINFVARPGQMIALVGHTGSGKTSIINLVSKFYLPTRGAVRIDGREIRTITGDSLHQQMGLVTQHNFLFSGTVLENVCYARAGATRADAERAAEQLGCADIFAALPHGWETETGERGSGLSLGQRQLVCFARALVADPRLLIFDEATSAIDAVTEFRIQRALVELLRGRTSFVVAHRLSTIRHADLVLVLDHGKLIERGTHAELMALGGHYAALYKQFVQVDDAA